MASSANSSVVLPNPYTPLAWLDPTTATEFEISRYIYVVALGALAWDWTVALPAEISIFAKTGLTVSTVLYLISRVGSMCYVITSTIFQIAPVPHCQALQVALGVCYIFASPFTSSLFYLRVIAVFSRQRAVVVLFGIVLVAVLACSAAIPFSIHGGHIGNTQFCINESVKDFASAGIISNTIFNALVFLSISYRLSGVSYGTDGTLRGRLSSFVGGQGLPRFSKKLLQGGQLYYGATVVMNIVTTVLLLSPGLPPSPRVMLTIPNIALENAMATRVYRDVHLGLISAGGQSLSTGDTSQHQQQRAGHSGRQVSVRPDEVFALETRMSGNRVNVKDQIVVTKETRLDVDDDVLRRGGKGESGSTSDGESGYGQV